MENKNTEVIKINPTEFGLTEETATNITRGLDQILKERVVLIEQYSEIITLDIDDPSTAKRAAELRKLIKNNRTQGIVKWHETNKEFYLRGGQFVDAIKKRELEVNNRMEEALEQIEKRQEILERERIANLQSLRASLISEYVENAERMDLGNMQLDVYEAFYAAKKKEYEDKKEAARLAEIERLKAEEAEIERKKRFEVRNSELSVYWATMPSKYSMFNYTDASEQEYAVMLSDAKNAKSEHEAEQARIKAENDRLKAEAEAKEKAQEAERKRMEEELRIEKEKAAKEKAERDEIIRKEQEAISLENARLANIERQKLNAEREANEKLQEELKAKQKAENDAYERKIAEEEHAKKEAEKLAKAPIKKQLNSWVNSFTLPLFATEHETAKQIIAKFESFKSWAETQVENI